MRIYTKSVLHLYICVFNTKGIFKLYISTDESGNHTRVVILKTSTINIIPCQIFRYDNVSNSQ